MSLASVSSVRKFDGTDYETWSVSCRSLLQEKEIWDDTIASEKPDTKKDTRALGVITLMLSDSVIKSMGILTMTSGKALWKNLEEKYNVKLPATKIALKKKLFNLKMKENEDVRKYIEELEQTVQQLSAQGYNMSDEDVAEQMLCGLPSSWEPVATALTASVKRDEKLTKTKVTSNLFAFQQTRQQEEEGDTAMVAARARISTYRPLPRSQIQCFNCNKFGHIARDCTESKRVYSKRADVKREDVKTAGRAYLHATAQDADDDDDEKRAFAYMIGSESKSKNEWIVDSGASQHMCNDIKKFAIYDKIQPKPVEVGNGQIIQAIGKGTVRLDVLVNDQRQELTLRNVLHVPEISKNLLSVSQATANGMDAVFGDNDCRLIERSSGETAVQAKRRGKMYALMEETAVQAMIASETSQVDLWHQRLGHLSVHGIKTLQAQASGISTLQLASEHTFCIACAEGKQAAKPVPKTRSGEPTTEPLALIHSDVVGPIEPQSNRGYKYFVSFVDDYSRHHWTSPMKNKSEVFNEFKAFKAAVEKKTGKKIKTLRTDNGGEYESEEMKKHLKQEGIAHQRSAPHTPQENGVAERCQRTIAEMSRSMLRHAKLDSKFWPYAVAMATHIKNLSPHRALANKTPQEVWSGQKPDVAHLRVFGCHAYVLIQDKHRTKMQSKVKKCILVGYGEPDGVKAYRLYDPDTKKIILSRNVVFDETSFGLPTAQETTSNLEMLPQLLEQERAQTESLTRADALPLSESPPPESPMPPTSPEPPMPPTPPELPMPPTLPEQESEDEEQVVELELRRSQRERRPSVLLRGYALIAEGIDLTDDVPENVVEAMNDGSWREAVESELTSLRKNEVYKEAELPQGEKVIDSKMIFKIKRDGEGKVVRHKARLVVRGFQQRAGIDYEDTFAPVVRFTTIRALLAVAAARNWTVKQLDVQTAFLHGDIDRTVYVRPPPGVEVSDGKVWLLRKALYGLKQAPRQWNAKLHSRLVELGFRQSACDPCLYVSTKSKQPLYVAVYVDDLLLVGDAGEVRELKLALAASFSITDAGDVGWLLGVAILRNGSGYALSQKQYAETILKRFGMAECKSVSTPLPVGGPAFATGDDPLLQDEEKQRYQSCVGALMYLAVATRPDLSAAVGRLGRYVAEPRQQHMVAAKHVLRYLRGTSSYSLQIGGDGPIVGYSDSDWAGDETTRRSTHGYVFSFGQGAVSWTSHRQPSVALSTAEAEYYALSECAKEAIWLQRLLLDLGSANVMLTLRCDNQAAIAMVKNPVNHARGKHIDLRVHFVRELFESGQFALEYVNTTENAADVMTKPLARILHARGVDMLGLKRWV